MVYMAPELFHVDCSNALTRDYREADLWSSGITVFFMLTNSLPFKTPASTIDFAKNPDRLFPRDPLDHCGVTEEGHAFIREAIRPDPTTRLNFATAMHHVWIQGLFPSTPVPDAQSRYV